MKNIIPLALLAVGAAVTANAQGIISWNDNNGNNIPSTGTAGVVPAINWNNSTGNLPGLVDNTGAGTTAGFTISGTWGAWGIAGFGSPDGDGTYNRTLLGGYANTSSGIGPEVFSISGIPYSTYNLIVYFDSDTAGRVGTIQDANAGITYDFSTQRDAQFTSYGVGGNAIFTQTIDTGGLNPAANCAIFLNLTGSSDTLTLNIPDGGGIAGFQIVAVPEPGTLALAVGGGLGLFVWRRRLAK